MSVEKNIGIDKLKQRIKEMFKLDEIENDEYNFLTNAESVAILRECMNLIGNIYKSINDNIPTDMIEIDIKKIWELLGEIIGETYKEELINQLFSQFCLGK